MTTLPPSLLELAQAFLPATLADSLAQATTDQATLAAINTQLEAVVTRLAPFAPPTVLDASTTAAPDWLNGKYIRGSVVLTQFVGVHHVLRRITRFDRKGNELFVTLLNQIIAALSEEVTTHGGDLARVSGDELTIVFDEAQFGSQHAELAAATALAMQQRMQAFASVQFQGETAHIQLRVAVHSGRFFVGEVGDATHKEYLISGLTIANTIQARDTAPPGHVIISDGTLRLLHTPTVEAQANGTHVLAALATRNVPVRQRIRAATPALLSPSPATLLQRIATLLPYQPRGLPALGHYDAAYGEFRPVTVVVISFSALKRLLGFVEMAATINHDAAILGHLIDTYYTAIQTSAQSYGGMINGVEMSASGDRLVVSFGALAAHDDDPRRAVALAMDMRRTMETLKTRVTDIVSAYVKAHPDDHRLLQVARSVAPVRVGIARGTMFAGLIGTPERHAYAVVGEPLDLANKLMGIAMEGEILVSAAVYRAVRSHVEAEPWRTMTIDEFAIPMSVFRVCDPGTDGILPTEPETPLVGRHAELAQLQSLSTQAFTSDPNASHIASITGEAGIGKTRMLNELSAIARMLWPDVRLIRETCHSYEHDRSYALICRLLTPLLGMQTLDPPEEQIPFVQQRVAELAAEWSRFVPLLAPLLDLPIAESKLTQALTPEQRRDRLHDLLVALLLAPTQPLLLIIDNVQWVDPSSAAVIERLALDVPGHAMLLALAYRTSVAFNQPWNALAHHTPVALEPLTNAESMALLEELLGTKPTTEVQPLVERANGIPLFLEQLVRYLIDSGMLRRDEAGDWHSTERFRIDSIPIEIEQIIVARIDKLSPEARLVVQLASVVGQPADQQIVSAMLPAEQPAPPVAELAHAHIFSHQETSTTPVYMFHSMLIRDVVYNGLAFARRRELHGQVAAAIERVYQTTIDSWHVAIAQHYLRAEQHDKAFRYLLLAAKQAQDRYANQEAIELYTQAMYIAPWRDAESPPEPIIAAPLYEGFGDVQVLIGSYDQAREQYSLLLPLFNSGSAEHALYCATLLRKLARTYESQGNFDTALERLHSATTMVTNAPATNSAIEEYAEILSDIGWIHFRRSDLGQAQLYLAQALGQLENEEVTTQTARILNRLGGIAWQQGDLAKAQSYVEQSLVASEKSGDLVGQANALVNLGLITEGRGELNDSIALGVQSLKIITYTGDRRGYIFAANNLGWTLYNQEEYLEAYKYFTGAVEQARIMRNSYAYMRSLRGLASVLIMLKQPQLAEQAIENAQNIALQLGLAVEQLDGLILRAELAFSQNDIQAATTVYQEASLLSIDTETEEYGRLQRIEAKLAYAQGDTARAMELLKSTEALFTQLQNIPEANRTRKLLAEIEAQE